MPSIAYARLVSGTNVETPQVTGSGRVAARVNLNFASTAGGAASFSIADVYGVLTDIFIRPAGGGDTPTDNFDITITDADGFTLYSNTGIDNATETHIGVADLDIAIAGSITITFANMGNAKKAVVQLKFTEERAVNITGTLITDGDKGDVTVADTGGTLLLNSGSVTADALAVGAVAELDPTPDSDHSFSGPSVTLTAGESLVFGDAVYVKSDGKMGKADATDATKPVCYMAAATIANNASGLFIRKGSIVRDDTWAWTVGGAIYLDTTAGALTQTAPSTSGNAVQKVGVALTADIIDFDPDSTIVVVA